MQRKPAGKRHIRATSTYRTRENQKGYFIQVFRVCYSDSRSRASMHNSCIVGSRLLEHLRQLLRHLVRD